MLMSKYKKYGKWFAIAAAGSGLFLLVILAVMGVPLWLAFILAVVGAVPGAIALGLLGAYAWLEMAPTPEQAERAERREQERQGQLFLERSKRGRPRKRQ